MRVFYDGIIYTYQNAGGINRYFANLINRLPTSFNPILTTSQVRKVNFPSHPNLKIFRYTPFRPGRISYRLEKSYFNAITKRWPYDILHPTYYHLLSRKEFAEVRKPIVLTVYDMIHEIFPDLLDRNGFEGKAKKKAIDAAQLIICISENTKEDLIKIHSIPETKIKVIPLASNLEPLSQSYPIDSSSLIVTQPYFLHVGSRTNYKNFTGLLRAFAKFRTAYKDVVLVVVGAPFSKDEGKLIAELQVENYLKNYNYVDDTQLIHLYRSSVALIYPSLYEGFGVPLLEAMSCGTPVVASNRSSIPEVTGDAALLFDPGSSDDLVDKLIYIYEDSNARQNFISKRYVKAKQFSWDKTVQETINVYRQLS